ncbi:MAG: hypothetical protein EWV53_18480 [Microcystis panniformis Mp_MB_F_20051200_S9]|uniref:Uncharacterized protein n=1 Tax=Microcystis panniformis Mp_MB_F_20051200_S9 TaxID=2486223 RepID=A0A552PNV3_9CHRO|nr:MAG: hypothetical protein EWV43_22330 [Microcystis panniformis Mp_MB_F_20080800_S26D]TRV43455.1 MAG: hypothetical protein EWV87_21095 [Microcystis panniformis Mp_GB_SS_20050300_S99]TRV53771.1 MAG: hypothetical protein EWV42_05425 [Microcystis panniformis Mp_GB_SS_20050300_S99D]TRV58660.1 MAG: hypothetical protein EWV53_18480 [Microcystis panniformis Mp_MB_F_20051200_S9]TRV61248.1 MAG: hypothetical protein EWV69_08255 [Microcystis panniformis Mp_MB_F_20080800_S26]TRV65789.1 MAG: hypothetical
MSLIPKRRERHKGVLSGMYGHSHRMGISVMSDLFGVKMSLWLKDPRGRTLSDEDILHYPYDSSNLIRNHENN